jgi:hypothetical protein
MSSSRQDIGFVGDTAISRRTCQEVSNIFLAYFQDVRQKRFFTKASMMGLIIFIGLWSFEPWGWKLAIILIPLSWAVYSMTLFVDYERGLGLITAPFLVVDALILNYLFKSQVSQLFNIISTSLFRMQWLVKALLLLALFLSLKDIFGGLVGLITIIVILIRPWSSKKNDKKLTKSKIYPRDEPDGGNYAVYRKNREGLKGILPACYPQRYARTKPFA